jgi:hypothetical protein
MLVLIFLTTVVVFLVDPISILACAIAAYFPRTWREAFLAGSVAGVAVASLSAILLNMNGRPFSLLYALAHVVSCIVGTLALRWIGRAIRSKAAT